MPDGRRKRRTSPIAAKNRWYAFSRGIRFRRRMNQSEAADMSDTAHLRRCFDQWRREGCR
jgi:hypothetical protein